MGRRLRDDLGVGRMMCLGGPTLNATLIQAGTVDELFLTMAPKLHGGAEMPTLMEGAGFEPRAMPVLELLSLYADGGELYLRYRLPPPVDLPRPEGESGVSRTSGRGL
jgi:riboflavin biosynthesis pyrimidine reductase